MSEQLPKSVPSDWLAKTWPVCGKAGIGEVANLSLSDLLADHPVTWLILMRHAG